MDVESISSSDNINSIPADLIMMKPSSGLVNFSFIWLAATSTTGEAATIIPPAPLLLLTLNYNSQAKA
ncbi:hypothetical protein F8M41_000238 [Gigaspora margarita]|uniref:Uncharacterized protein n=1 Tax=Gigaspora margarita TaxID=4874 RepID=A0A8H4AA16_GIGMA|nr:hypothetical protein F8M41_000238 [Gigaspora margarita]